MNSENDDTDDTYNGILWFEMEAAGFIGDRLKAAQPASRPASYSGSAAAPSLTAS